MAEDPKRAERLKQLRADPEAFVAIQMDEMNSRLADIADFMEKTLSHLRETTPEGIDFPIADQTVTATSVLVRFERDYPNRLLRSVDFYNKGATTVYIRVNEDAKEIPLDDQAQITISRPRATIKYVMLRTASSSTTVKMVGHV